MATWRKTINLNQIITAWDAEADLSDPEEPVPAAIKDKIVAELNKATELTQFVGRVNRCPNVRVMNGILAHIYDEADRFKIWTGG